MKHITFFLDFVSPYAWLAFARMPLALEGLSYSVSYQPVLLGALLQQQSNPGPAGIPPKRDWTYRHAVWLGHALGVGLDMPAQHPFNPVPLLRLSLACSETGQINRYVAEACLRHVWQGGADALNPERLTALREALASQMSGVPDAESRAKEMLRRNTESAAAAGVFGVPAFEVDGRVFWGLDALPMLRAYLEGDAWFEGPAWQGVCQTPSGLAPK